MSIRFNAPPRGFRTDFSTAYDFVATLQRAYGLPENGVWDATLTDAMVATLAPVPGGAPFEMRSLQALRYGQVVPEEAALSAFNAYAVQTVGRNVPVVLAGSVTGWLHVVYGQVALGRPQDIPGDTFLGIPKPVAFGVGMTIGGVALLVGVGLLIRKAIK